MKQEVKTPRPHSKKLFEWDSERGVLTLLKRRKKYMFELAEDLTFSPLAEEELPDPQHQPKK